MITAYNLCDLNAVFKNCDTKERERKSPITYVAKFSPPTLWCAETSDYLVFAISSEKLFESLKECNVPCKLKLSIGGGHCFGKVHNMIGQSIDVDKMQNSIVDFILMYMEKNND